MLNGQLLKSLMAFPRVLPRLADFFGFSHSPRLAVYDKRLGVNLLT